MQKKSYSTKKDLTSQYKLNINSVIFSIFLIGIHGLVGRVAPYRTLASHE